MRHVCLATPPLTRRNLLAIGAGAAAAAVAGPSAAAGHCDVLLLTCMDYRLTDDIARYMDGRGLRDGYDHVVLAGASLGALARQRPDWGRTFWQHLDAAIALHGIKRVVVIDHLDCGAYRLFLGEKAVDTPAKEYEAHAAELRRLRKAINSRRPKLEVELGLMALDGSVGTIA